MVSGVGNSKWSGQWRVEWAMVNGESSGKWSGQWQVGTDLMPHII